MPIPKVSSQLSSTGSNMIEASMTNGTQEAQGPPYIPMVWPLGGLPAKGVDIPAQTVFMVFFMIGAAVHMTIFRKNRTRGHKFLPNLFMFGRITAVELGYQELMLVLGFCMERILTSIVRIASVCNPKNVTLLIASQVLVAAGTLILFVINLIFAMRLVRSTHSSVGWHPAFGIAFKVLFVLIGLTLIALIASTVQSFFTLDSSIRAIDRGIQQFGATFLAIVATLPLPITMLTLLIPYSPLDRFGIGRLRTKVIVLIISTTLLSIGAWFRCGVAFQKPVPRTAPMPGYLAKAPFYLLNFLVEVQTVLMYAILRVDLRWHIPNGARGPGSYSRREAQQDLEMQDSRPASSDTVHEAEMEEMDTKSLNSLKTVTGVDEREMASEKSPVFPKADTIEIDIGKGLNDNLAIPGTTPTRISNNDSLAPPIADNRSARGSILSERLSRIFTKSTASMASFTTAEPRHESEEARIIRRLGGPWERLPSPTFSEIDISRRSSKRSVFSGTTADGEQADPEPRPPYVHHRTDSGAPSIPDVVNEGGWTPKIEWGFNNPKRFLSLKKRSMIGLEVPRKAENSSSTTLKEQL
ncbi:family c-likeg- -coupled receptor [Pyrenophora seminiperda CCB06]|uniref:Family c-likeg--coupled receptor n=1 Tax=Pyrenophora seminiperda CCB06 TaxID=1302712 RepID=A0A3M7MDQ5_9PLEO|nr:family c-likeg- -coupled receptor [Pyrenophora seminiperda CCB06]